MTCDAPVVSGPTALLTDWIAVNGGFPQNPASVTLPGGVITLANALWGVGASFSDLIYVPSTSARFQGPAGQVLAGFLLPIPFGACILDRFSVGWPPGGVGVVPVLPLSE